MWIEFKEFAPLIITTYPLMSILFVIEKIEEPKWSWNAQLLYKYYRS
jgi:hypothetical protein